MAHKIKINNTGHEFIVQDRASILKGGLLEGVNLDHNCANGSCGECKARLIDGEIESIRHHDYRLTDDEKEQGGFLMCCHRAASDLTIETHESDTAADIPEQHIKAKVGKIELLQDGVMQFQLRTPRSKGLHFLAGQKVELSFLNGETGNFAMASCPCDSIQLRFHYRQRENCKVSDYLFDELKKGREVAIRGPVGDFTLIETSNRPIIFVAWESGFAAIASIIDHVIQKNEDLEIHLYWLSAIPLGHYLSNYCRTWEDALDNFHYHSIDLSPAGEASFTGTIDDIIGRHGPIVDWDMYINGPVENLSDLESTVSEAGLPSEQLKLMSVEQP